jgi:hypothetical protein
MSDGLGVSSISGAFLEKVTRDECLSRDLPRKGRDQRSARPRPDGGGRDDADDESGSDREPAPSAHIDLRA